MNDTMSRDNWRLRVYYLRYGAGGPIVSTIVTPSKVGDIRKSVTPPHVIDLDPSAELLAEWDKSNHPTGDTFGGALLSKLKAQI